MLILTNYIMFLFLFAINQDENDSGSYTGSQDLLPEDEIQEEQEEDDEEEEEEEFGDLSDERRPGRSLVSNGLEKPLRIMSYSRRAHLIHKKKKKKKRKGTQFSNAHYIEKTEVVAVERGSHGAF